MRAGEVEFACGDLPGLLRSPEPGVPVRGGVVALPGSSLPHRRQPIFDHLAASLCPVGFAVLSVDRRPWTTWNGTPTDTPLEVQAADALAAVSLLYDRLEKPVGLFGFSQGAWSAAIAASRDPTVAFLIALGCSGVSPAAQMRFYTDELLRRAGYDQSARSHLRRLRLAVEELLRGCGDRERASRLLDDAIDRPWFSLAYLDDRLPEPQDTWHDMDYDPEPTFGNVQCPALVIYGEDEECVPAEPSKAAWIRATRESGNHDLTIVDLPGCGHFPAPGADASSLHVSLSAFSDEYTAALQRWR